MDDIIAPVESSFVSPLETLKNNGKCEYDPELCRFTIDNKKVNVIMQQPQFPIPVIQHI